MSCSKETLASFQQRLPPAWHSEEEENSLKIQKILREVTVGCCYKHEESRTAEKWREKEGDSTQNTLGLWEKGHKTLSPTRAGQPASPATVARGHKRREEGRLGEQGAGNKEGKKEGKKLGNKV